jgi:hypothetical protein
MPPKLKNWGKPQKEECVKQFNLFETTNGSDGWDPREVDDSYIKPRVKLNNVCRPYLSVALGGHSKNKDSSKAIRGYRRAASEYFVTLAKGGIRRSTCTVRCGRISCMPLIFSLLFHFPCITGDYLEDKFAGGKRKAEAEALDSEDDDSEDDDDDDINMAKKPAATKTPKTPKAPAKDKEVDDLADQVQSQVNLGSWFVVDRNQHFGIVAVVFTNPANKTRYVHIRTEFVGSI